MKFLQKMFFLTLFSLYFSSCSLLYQLLSGEHAEDTKIEKITSKFSLSDNLVYITYYDSNPSYSTFVIDVEKKDVISRIYYTDGKHEFGALQVTPYEGRLWMLGTTNACKVLIFNPETGKTEETIPFTEWNAHRMNFLPSINKLAVMHGNRYEKGCSVSLINLSSHKYEGLAYIQQIAPKLEDINGKIYGSEDDFRPLEDGGFGIYSLDGDAFTFDKKFSVSPATDSQLSSVVVNKFLVLDDGTYVVCDDTIGIKILYPDKSIGEIWYGEETDDYRFVGNIYYSGKYDRIYVEGGTGYRLSYLEKDSEGKWSRNESNIIPFTEYHGSRACMLNGDTWVLTYPSDDYSTFIVKFYDISDMTLKKEIRWNLHDDTMTDVSTND